MRLSIPFAVVILALAQQACSRSHSVEDTAADIISAVNSGDSRALWAMTSTRSKNTLSEQLSGLKSNLAGREHLNRYLGLELSDSEIESLTAEDFFVHMMASDPGWGVQQLELVRVELVDVDDDYEVARVIYQAEGKDGVNILIKEDGQWRFDYDF